MLLYGSGLRLLEALRLRVKDVDFGRRQIFVRDAKANRDRATMLPVTMTAALREHLERVRICTMATCEMGPLGIGSAKPTGRTRRGGGFFAVAMRRIRSRDNHPPAAISSHLACYDSSHRERSPISVAAGFSRKERAGLTNKLGDVCSV